MEGSPGDDRGMDDMEAAMEGMDDGGDMGDDGGMDGMDEDASPSP